MVGSVNWGGIAAIVAAVAWAVLVLALFVVMMNVFRLLESTKTLVDGLRDETVPLLRELRVTVKSVNQELERVDGLMETAGRMAKSAERIGGVVEQTISSPLIKIASFGAGASRAVGKLRGSK